MVLMYLFSNRKYRKYIAEIWSNLSLKAGGLYIQAALESRIQCIADSRVSRPLYKICSETHLSCEKPPVLIDVPHIRGTPLLTFIFHIN